MRYYDDFTTQATKIWIGDGTDSKKILFKSSKKYHQSLTVKETDLFLKNFPF